ncbi:NAD(P)-binding protein [Microthyrium microscopicum]|uniref:NAD(P)-binding protein n=1 Tax=Microthyrium microscopicum TaxID=703497 RepID=A0A6A6TVU9_9PEZI|nr:NAD(P)-binding protein [Microthyrium microscopicum]
MSLKNVVVAGGSGNLGPAIVNELLAAGINITATKRPDSSSTFPDGVKVVTTDYSFDSLVKIFQGQDAVLALLNGAAFSKQNTMIDAAVEAGVKRFFTSEFGSDTRDPEVRKAVTFFQPKHDAVEYAKSKESQGLTWTAIITGPFFDWGLKMGFLGADLKKHTAEIWDGGNNKFSGTNLSTIGKAIAAILSKAGVVEATKNQYVTISSFTTTQNEVHALLEEITGEKWPTTAVDSDAKIEEGKKAMAAGDHYGAMSILKAYAFGGKVDADLSNAPGGLWNDKLGLPREDLKATLKKLLAA